LPHCLHPLWIYLVPREQLLTKDHARSKRDRLQRSG